MLKCCSFSRTLPLPVIPAPLSNIGILVPCTSNTDFKFKLVTQINTNKSMRRERAGISKILIGGCWKLVTSSPVPPEQGPGLCVGQGFLFRLCHHAVHDMHATGLQTFSDTLALPRATLTSVLTQLSWVLAAEKARSRAAPLLISAYSKGAILRWCSGALPHWWDQWVWVPWH